MSRAAVGGILALLCATATAGETRKFPYEAVVTQETQARSGPGKQKFYATSTLKPGDTVQVIRHDPGGWYMIDPPAGSFSWIPAKFIDRHGQTGTVNANNVMVYVGSADSATHGTSQRRLSQDTDVRILGEQVLESESGAPEKWYRIQPPAYERRWVMGQHLAVAGMPDSKSDIALAAAEKTARPTTVQRIAGPTATQKDPEKLPVVEAATMEVEAEQRKSALAPLDAEYRRQLSLPASEQDFAKLQSAYQELRDNTDNSELQRMVDKRLSTIHYQARESATTREIELVTTEAQQRQAELVAQQHELERRLAAPRPSVLEPVPQPVSGGVQQPTPITPVQGQPTSVQPTPIQPTTVRPRLAAPGPDQPHLAPAAHSEADVASTPVKPHPAFDGAGIVQRAPAGAPTQFVLITPQGKVLAFLAPQGEVDIESFVGRAAGVRGRRQFHPEWRTDGIEVSSLVLVRLK